MKQILTHETAKLIPTLVAAISTLGNGIKRVEAEAEVEVGGTAAIVNVTGYWVGDMARLDIKFRS